MHLSIFFIQDTPAGIENITSLLSRCLSDLHLTVLRTAAVLVCINKEGAPKKKRRGSRWRLLEIGSCPMATMGGGNLTVNASVEFWILAVEIASIFPSPSVSALSLLYDPADSGTISGLSSDNTSSIRSSQVGPAHCTEGSSGSTCGASKQKKGLISRSISHAGSVFSISSIDFWKPAPAGYHDMASADYDVLLEICLLEDDQFCRPNQNVAELW